MYGSDVGTWEDYAMAFVFGSVTSAVGKVSSSVKTLLDVAARPAANQVVKMGTRGKPFNVQKYAYDVVTRAATAGGSDNVISSKVGVFNLKVDVGKCFYRATTRKIYSYFQ